MSIKYIDNNQQKGIKIDWNHIFREYKKLKCPDDVYDPTSCPIESVNWCVFMSARSRGKTTAWLLIGLLLYREYGIQIGYIRQTDRMTSSTKTRDLFNVVCEFGYIPKIFGDKWNSVYLWQKHFYLCNRDDDGKLLEKAEDDFCICLSIDKSYEYKSTLTRPRTDLLIFDEFISNRYAPDEFIDLCQLISTIRRKRQSTKILCLSNMVTPYSEYLEEMGLRDTALKLTAGEHTIVESVMGAKVYYEVIDLSAKIISKQDTWFNKLYFGFANKKLSAITGEEWEITNYPHLPHREKDEVRTMITRDVYVRCFGKYVVMEFWHSDILGDFLMFRPFDLQVPREGIVFTDELPLSKSEVYGMGEGTDYHKLWYLYMAHRDYYSSNEIGHMIETYVSSYDNR